MILHGELRNHNTKGDNNKLRRNGKIPGNIYGKNLKNMLVEFAELEVFNVLRKNGEHGILDVDVDGKTYKAIIKEVQKDPLTKKIIHLDLYKVDDKEKIHAKVPVVIKGEEYLKGMNAVVQKIQDEVEVECSADKVPKFIVADITKINKDKITVSDLEIAEEISVIAPPNALIATIVKANQIVEEDKEEAWKVSSWIFL